MGGSATSLHATSCDEFAFGTSKSFMESPHVMSAVGLYQQACSSGKHCCGGVHGMHVPSWPKSPWKIAHMSGAKVLVRRAYIVLDITPYIGAVNRRRERFIVACSSIFKTLYVGSCTVQVAHSSFCNAAQKPLMSFNRMRIESGQD